MDRLKYTTLILLMAWPASRSAASPTRVSASPTRPNPRREIQEVLRRSDDSLHQKDIRGCMVGFTPDFHGESINGDRYDGSQAKQNLIKSLSSVQSIKANTKVKSTTLMGQRAVVVSQEHTALMILGRRTHRLHTLVFDGLWRGTWVDTKAGWKEQSEKQLTSTVTTDGIPRVVHPGKAK